jgi:hypothetical protein
MSQYSHTRTVEIGGSEVEVEFDYNLSPVIPEQGPSYASGGQPAEGGELEITGATIIVPGNIVAGKKTTERHDAPPWLLTLFQNDDYIADDLREAAHG